MSNCHIIDRTCSSQKLSDKFEDYPEGMVIVVDKPYRWSSADVVRKAKFQIQRFFKKKNIKVGHAGTLDPLATGILLLCIGKATKSAEALQAQTKEYIAEISFGATTPSFDLEKEIDHHYPYAHIDYEMIESALSGFIGEIDQIPPVFSAKLIDGVRAYEYARSGEEVEMRSSRVKIYELEIISYQTPTLLLRIKCSKGTYIRSLARDLGITLNSGAHLTNLVRTVSGDFNIGNALKMEDIELLFQ